ncbi:hypothetical protein FB45DRAFT_1033476 [Roridomyces roridus]|uniref:Uncharacterized protein n=1 Tax=Roridomyces roridus TaxID=1738132 RepID=A0AAD7BFH5_9AGAR|nr:hypothetical protein FB45DRAFT_1033476 [Roridomyces roridus]
MRGLGHLTIDDFPVVTGVVSCLAKLTFPNLLSCLLSEIGTDSWNLHVAQFLRRHPTITHLSLESAPKLEGPIAEGDLLPKLQYYCGDLKDLRFFSTHGLVAVRITWNVQLQSLVERLAAQTGPNLTGLYIDLLSVADFPGVLIHLSTHMPHLEKLKLRWWEGSISGVQAIIDHITAYLPQFERLAYLVVNFAHRDDVVIDSDSQRRTFQAWTNVCSKLRGCCIGKASGYPT